jgi:hypothetical protein
MQDCIVPTAHIVTDEWASYRPTTRGFPSHRVVRQSAGECAREDVYTNNAEVFFSRLKRRVRGAPQGFAGAPAPLRGPTWLPVQHP